MTASTIKIDRLVLDIDPALGPLGVEHTDTVLVTGSWMAGSTTLAAELADRLPDLRVVEADELPSDEVPSVVVYVSSAIAPLTGSDCRLIDIAAANTDAVVGVVSKIDVHRSWRDVMRRNAEALAHHDVRFGDVAWLGVSSHDDGPGLDELVRTIGAMRGDTTLAERNRLRAWEFRLNGMLDAAAVPSSDADADALRHQRQAAVRRNRASRSERLLTLRNRVAQARVSLQYFARQRVSSVATELDEDIAELRRKGVAPFVGHARERMAEVAAEVEAGADDQLAEIAAEVTYSRGLVHTVWQPTSPPVPPEPRDPPLRSRRLETRMMALFGVVFGLGAALTVSRLVAFVVPGVALIGLGVGLVAGAGAAVWLTAARGLLHDRVVLRQWVTESLTALRNYLEQRVAARVLDAETQLNADLAAADDRDSDKLAAQVDEIDTRLREQARAQALRSRDLSAARRALSVVAQRLDAATRRQQDQTP